LYGFLHFSLPFEGDGLAMNNIGQINPRAESIKTFTNVEVILTGSNQQSGNLSS
jgi:hypothetical protein